ncbi:helix-turn-helix transcriptional regulator [Streptomyces sp. NPDC051976]|uniref:helix-turn-helix domain-containing protein n=1 Tax=Streptomyces sp. NPDC051976 TaxID=3154947 RepID=UPI00341C1435
MLVGEMLRRLRTTAGFNEAEAAKAIGKSYSSKISRMESGQHSFKASEITGLMDFYGLADLDQREDLMGLALKANEPGWWDAWSDVSTKFLQTHVSLEEVAQRIRSYESHQLLGLLQVPDYARALVRANAPGQDQRAVDRIVEFRAMRQERFLDASEAVLVCLLDEVSLTRGYGTSTTMRRQLDHLIALADHPRIVLHMVPLNRRNVPVQIGTTAIFDFADGQLPPIVYNELANGGQYIQDPERVDEHAKGFDRLLATCLNPLTALRRLQDYRKKVL